MTGSIWTENKNPGTKDTMQPGKLILPEGALQKINNLSLNFNQFFGYITAAKFDTKAGLDGFTDSSKLMPGVGDYYKVLSRMGDPIKKFSDVTMQQKATNPNFKLGNKMKIWQRANECIALVTALRRMDQDKYRIPYIRDNLPKADGWPEGVTPELEKTDLDTELKRSISVIDFLATISKYQDTIPDIEPRLKTVNGAFMTTAKGTSHNSAIVAAQEAMVSCECTKDFVSNTLKRQKRLNGGARHDMAGLSTCDAVN
jgi:hypothetical protein